jgi:hypothetical protein
MMMRTLIKAAAIASAVLGGLAAVPAAAQGRHDRGGYDNSYSDNARWDGNRGNGYDRGRSYRRDRDDEGRGYRRDRDDDRGRHHHRHRGWSDR